MDYTDEVTKLKEELHHLLDKFTNKMIDEIKKQDIYRHHLKQRVAYLSWTNKKYDLLFVGDPDNVQQRDVFYCEFGFNIGSEQKENRPAVILQNNRGNNTSRTTIVAPVSTHRNCDIFEVKGKKYIRYLNEDGREITKKLDYYEIPIVLEKDFGERVRGYINIAQIKTISKKRLSRRPVGRITKENFMEIKLAMNRLFELT